jgi:K+-transporting ATPase KdpF subunit
MKMYVVILQAGMDSPGLSNHNGYVAGCIIALFILGYLIYSLLEPEKF